MTKLLTIEDVCALLNCTKRTIYNWIKTDGFPAPIKLSAQTRAWREEDVEDWVISREKAPIKAA